MTRPFANPAIAAIYDGYPPQTREIALMLRDLIFDVAADNPQVGTVEEALRWGQPAYLTPKTKSGSTLRIAMPKAGGCGLYAHCQTTIISTYAATFGDADQIEGNRAVLFARPDDIAPDRLRHLIKHALTYHL